MIAFLLRHKRCSRISEHGWLKQDIAFLATLKKTIDKDRIANLTTGGHRLKFSEITLDPIFQIDLC